MGLDDLDRIAAAAAAFSLFSIVLVGGPAVFVSRWAWKWALRRVSERQRVRPARVLGQVALVASGLPAAGALGRALSRIPHAGDRNAELEEVARDVGLPTFSGKLRRRALLGAFGVVLAWTAAFLTLALLDYLT